MTHRRNRPQPLRRQKWARSTPQEILAKLVVGKADPMVVLETLIELYNNRHSALEKTVSFKTRQQRALFLRRFFRELPTVADCRIVPDPRNIGERHIERSVRHWRDQNMSIGTIQTYLSFLRGLCAWIGKPGMVRTARDYGYTGPGRTEAAQRDKSWSSQGVDVDKKIEAVEKEDPRVGMALRLMFAFGMRCKEAVMFRPHRNVLSFEETGLGVPLENAKSYIHIKQGSKGGRPRFVAVCTPRQLAVLAEARGLAASVDASISDPMRPLKSCLRRFYYVVGKMGITHKEMNTASHGLRHEVNQDKYEEITGVPAPVRGGHCTDRELDKVARLEVSRMAGHARAKASSAYLGSAAVMRSKVQKKPPGAQPDLDVDASPQRKPNEDE